MYSMESFERAFAAAMKVYHITLAEMSNAELEYENSFLEKDASELTDEQIIIRKLIEIEIGKRAAIQEAFAIHAQMTGKTYTL